MAAQLLILACSAIALALAPRSSAQLTANFYNQLCPQALATIRLEVAAAILLDPRMGASLLRLHFHDCFVNGCDGSILLDDTPTIIGEKTAVPNFNSVRGYDVIDKIKKTVNTVCLGNVVSCADILAVAARDSIDLLGGTYYQVLLGRRDSTNASKDAANSNLPSPFADLDGLLSNFQSHNLTLNDLVVLSGGHTIGFARCITFRSRIYNETNIDSTFAATVQARCPLSGGDNNLTSFDDSPASVDTHYYTALVNQKGLLHSDQQLFKGDNSTADGLVKHYSETPSDFWADFATAMIKMGNMSPLTGSNGQIRRNCSVVN